MLPRFCVLQELEECRRALESEKVASIQHIEAARQAAATEKTALSKKYQVRVASEPDRAQGRRVEYAIEG